MDINIYYNEHLQSFGLYKEAPKDYNYIFLGNQDFDRADSFITFLQRTFLYKNRNFQEIQKKYQVYFGL